MKRLVFLILGAALLAPGAGADGIPPVTLKVVEQDSGKLLVQWRVPKQIPHRAIPSPVLPESCTADDERSVIERPGTWSVRQTFRCSDDLAGQTLGIDYPFPNAAIATLVQVELFSGERLARMLAPGEETWRLPESSAGGAPAWMREAGEGALAGIGHLASNGVHVAFLLSLVLLGGLGVGIRLVTAFAVGQAVSIAWVASTAIGLDAPLAEIGLAVAAALLAREALRPPVERRQLSALAVAAGLVHGSGVPQWAFPDAGVVSMLGVLIGMDGSLLLAVMMLAGLGRLVPRALVAAPARTVAVYTIAVAALALALGAARVDPEAGERSGGLKLEGLVIPEGGGGAAGSRRVAARVADAVVQSFVNVEAFEVRHEVLVRLLGVAGRVDVEAGRELAVERQDAVKDLVRDMVAERASVAIDGSTVEPTDVRSDFLLLDATGALPRRSPVPEVVEAAWLGVTTVYMTATTPREVSVRWSAFDLVDSIPATVTDPESSRSIVLSAEKPVLEWINELEEDPAPVVTAVAVEPATVWVPVWSLLPLGGALILGWAALRGRRRELSIAGVRVLVAGALLLAPAGGATMALPFSRSVPDAAGVKRILSGVLPNVYRAFEFPTESAVYDRLALSVTGETLTEVYLENRRSVEMEERGGARVRIEAVEVVEVDSVEPGDPDGFVADAVWSVGGTVTHFGHRHFRQNRYDARVTVVPEDGRWKIRSIEILDEQRVR